MYSILRIVQTTLLIFNMPSANHDNIQDILITLYFRFWIVTNVYKEEEKKIAATMP